MTLVAAPASPSADTLAAAVADVSVAAPATPTRQTYHELQWAYDHFNQALFDGLLRNDSKFGKMLSLITQFVVS